MAGREQDRVAEIRGRAKAVVDQLQAAKVEAGERPPAAVEKLFRDLAGIAHEFHAAASSFDDERLQERRQASRSAPDEVTAAATSPCRHLVTYWNSFLSAMGYCNDWDQCWADQGYCDWGSRPEVNPC